MIGHVIMINSLLYVVRFSRTAILRHRASDYDLEMKNDGFVLVDDLLKLSKRTAAGIALSSHSEEDVRKVTFFFPHVYPFEVLYSMLPWIMAFMSNGLHLLPDAIETVLDCSWLI